MNTTRWLSRLAVLVVLAVVVAGILAACGGTAHEGAKYHCPMHPTYISDRPGDCPICGMRLVPIEEKIAPTTVPKYACPMHPEVTSDKPGPCPKCGMKLEPAGHEGATPPAASEQAPPASSGERRALFYRSPMNPNVTSPAPAKDEMGMDFVPVYSDEVSGGQSPVPGMATIQLGASGLHLAGVQTTPAALEDMLRTIRTVGTVVPDETRIHHFHTRVSGWVERLYVNFTGQFVKHGQPILSLYSPQLVASQEEYLRAREAAARFAASDLPEVRKGGEDLLRAARRRLELFDVPEGFIQELERTGVPQRDVTLVAHGSGFVTTKGIFEGQQVDPNIMELFTITDLSHVWIEGNFYEYEASSLRLGQGAKLTLPYDPSVQLSGRIAYVYPTLAPDSRTVKVRFEFANPSLALKPGMFANVELRLDAGKSIVIPDSAVMDTGERQVVFVAVGEDRFAPREIKVGVRSAGKAQVVAGLGAGEKVVLRANFLLDSESRLRAAIAGAGTGAAQKPGGGR